MTKKRLANIIDKMKTPVIQLDIDGNFIQAFESISCAQKLLNNKGIASCICRKKYISKGFIFKQIKKECFIAIAALRDDDISLNDKINEINKKYGTKIEFRR